MLWQVWYSCKSPNLTKDCLQIDQVPFIFNIAEFKKTIIMASKKLLTSEVISQAESYDGIRAGIILPIKLKVYHEKALVMIS